MAYKQVLLGDYFKFEKGLGYKGEFLAEDSDVALIGMDSHEEGGGYKEGSEKFYSGPFKSEHVAEVGDVIFAGTEQGFGLLASPLIVPESEKFNTYLFSGDVLKAIPLKSDEFSVEYLYNIYRVEKYRVKTAYGDTGTTVRRISNENFAEQLVPLPDLSTQLAINEIISLIDQQIANNKSLSKNLELLAQSIFKSWFIDFDPVHAKSRGEKPIGMDHETAALFPDSFEESELGMIPKGWEVARFGDLGKIVTGKTPSTKNPDYWGGDIPFVTIPDITKNRYTLSAERYLSAAGANSQKKQYLPAGTTSVSCIATPGLVAFAFMTCQTNQQINSIIPSIGMNPAWLFFRIDSEIQQIKERSGIGTVFSNLNKSDFSSLTTVLPNLEIREKYGQVVTPFLESIKNCISSTSQLTALQESLLPRLITGELQIPEELLVS